MKKKFNNTMMAISYEKIAFFFIWAGIILVLLHLFLFYYQDTLLSLASSTTLQTLGQFGEYYAGMVGAIWSLASVILFYEALKFQRRELTLQRHELELNRNELLEQTQQYRDQNRLLGIQNNENTLFQLLMLHSEIVKSISYEKKYGVGQAAEYTLIGRDSFKGFYSDFTSIYNDHIDLLGVTSPSNEDMMEIINETFNKFIYQHHTAINHYLRNIYNIMDFIDHSSMENKKFYKNLVTSQLSDKELVLLFYYCLSEPGITFKPLAEKYSFFLNLQPEELMDRRHKELLDEKAFD